jgi:hypothetical protein
MNAGILPGPASKLAGDPVRSDQNDNLSRIGVWDAGQLEWEDWISNGGLRESKVKAPRRDAGVGVRKIASLWQWK